MENTTVTFEKKWLDRAVHYRFKINNWFQKFGLNGFAWSNCNSLELLLNNQ